MYLPLPDNLAVLPSPIHDAGLFATQDIKEGHEFGISHVEDEEFKHGYIRTPLGGFFNHSDDPNCEAYKDGRFIKLKATKDIKAGEELTALYWLYPIDF